METDRLYQELFVRLRDMQPVLTWPESQQLAAFGHLRDLAEQIGEEHSSCLLCFDGWEYTGALRVRSGLILASAEAFWEQGHEPLCLLTADLRDGLLLDYTEPKQMHGNDEYEFYGWGAFTSIARSS